MYFVNGCESLFSSRKVQNRFNHYPRKFAFHLFIKDKDSFFLFHRSIFKLPKSTWEQGRKDLCKILNKIHLDLFTRQNLLSRYFLRTHLGKQEIQTLSLKNYKAAWCCSPHIILLNGALNL